MSPSRAPDARRLAVVGLLLAGCVKHIYPDGLGLEGQLEREVVALNQKVRSMQGELETCTYGGEPGPLYTELHQVFSGTEIAIERRGAIIVVALPVAHLFTDTYGLWFREEANPSLDLLATALAAYPNQKLVVEGHTDDAMIPGNLAGRYESHLELSFRYAAAVVQRLSEQGVGGERLTVAGRGRWAPVASNDTPGGQAKNRRVEVQIYPAGVR